MLSRVGPLGYGERRVRFQKLRADSEVFALAQAVADEAGVCLTEIMRRRRGFGRAAMARQLAMYLAHVRLSRTRTEVAELFCRDRKTVAHALQSTEDRRDSPVFERLIERIERRFDRACPPTRRVRHGA